MKKNIKVKVHDDRLLFKFGDWVDLKTIEPIEMSKFDYQNIKLNVCVELPKGYEALLIPRSSTFSRYGIIMVNGIGLIDEDYKGNDDVWQFPALCMWEHTFIPKGSRIAQFRIMKHQPKLKIEYATKLSENNRGGIGSTGY